MTDTIRKLDGPKASALCFAAAAVLIFVVFFLVDDHQLTRTIEDWDMIEGQEVVVEEGTPERRIGFLLLGFFGIAGIVLGQRQEAIQRNSVLSQLIIFFVGWSFLSLAWSFDVGLTSRRLGVLALLCLGAFGTARTIRIDHIPHVVFLVTGTYLLLGFAGHLLLGTFLPFDPDFRFAGGLHPNHQGVNCSLLLLSALFLFAGMRPVGKILMASVAVAALFFLMLTRSRTSLIGAGAALLAYWIMSVSGPRRIGITIGLGVIVTSILLLVGESLFSYVGEAAQMGRQEELTVLSGRVPLWEECVEFIASRPFCGYGYGAFWTPAHIAEISKLQEWPVAEAHSAYVDTTLSLGIIGGSAYALILLGGISRAFRRGKAIAARSYNYLGLLLLFIVAEGILESTTIAPSLLYFLCILGFMYLCSRVPNMADGGEVVKQSGA